MERGHLQGTDPPKPLKSRPIEQMNLEELYFKIHALDSTIRDVQAERGKAFQRWKRLGGKVIESV